MIELDRRAVMAGTLAALGECASSEARPLHGGISTGGGGSTLLKTLTVVNTSGSTVAANSHTPTIGLLFKKGDVPTGYPILKDGANTVLSYTYWNKVTWSDGSLKFLACMPRMSASIAGSGTDSIKVYNGGSAQSASNRTLSEVYAANITMVGTNGLGPGISGNYTCDLQAANVIETIDYGNGPAGRVWRFLCNFNQAGTPHGQLVTYFYLMALQDASGNLAGFRVLPRSTQPWYNIDSPAKDYVSFASLVLQYGAGPTTYDPMATSYSAKTFTWSSGSTYTATNHGYTNGMAVRLTTTGTLPAGLSTNTTYWVYLPGGASTLQLVNGSSVGNLGNGVSGVAATNAGTGTHTMTPIAYISYFCSYFVADTNGKYIYVQGGGSVASEATLRIQFDNAYDTATKIIPIYDLTIGSVTSNSSYNWAPYSIGPLYITTGSGGERDDIGPYSAYQCRHLYTQAEVDERMVRITGLALAMQPTCLKDHTTKNLANISNNSYTGMPAAGATTFQYRPTNSSCAPFTAPASGTGGAYTGANWTQVFDGPGATHSSQFAHYPLVITGEPQYSDLLAEQCNAELLVPPSNERNLVVGGTTYYSIGPAFKDSVRSGAWLYRDIVLAASLAPDTPPDGSDSTSYFKDNAARQSTYMLAYNATQSAWWTTNGFWFPQSMLNDTGSWQNGYDSFAVAWHAAVLEDANALTMLGKFALWPPHVQTFTGNLWCLASYYHRSGATPGTVGVPIITSDLEWVPFMNNAGGLSWATATDVFTWTTPQFTPANNDKIIFWTTEKPGGFTAGTAYYAVSVSGNTFKLATSIGGSAVHVTADGSISTCLNVGCIPTNPPSTGSVGEGPGVSNAGYVSNQCGWINWALALGVSVTGLAGCSTELLGRLSGVTWGTNPKYKFRTAY